MGLYKTIFKKRKKIVDEISFDVKGVNFPELGRFWFKKQFSLMSGLEE